MKKKALVFGGSGFLGSHVCDSLIEKGYEVTVFDKLKSNFLDRKIKFIKGDITDFNSVLRSVKGKNIVYNFAALSNLTKAINEPLGTINNNIVGTYNILESSKRHKVNRVIHASTIYAYSDEGGFYRCSKQSAELYVKEYKKKYRLNYTIIRYGSLYGPRSGEDNQIFKIIKKALKTGKIEYQGSPENIREYIHVIDAAKIATEVLLKKYSNQSVIASGHQSMSVKQLLGMIAEILKIKENKIFFNKKKLAGHYKSTPYSHSKEFDNKIIVNNYIDIGQGLLNLIKNISYQKN